jgi:septal ring factor EnvC (AmiA/AmiB activator)
VDDLLTRFAERFGEIAEDVHRAREETTEGFRQFRPMITDHSEIRADLRRAISDIRELRAEIEHLEGRLDHERVERQKGQEERRQELVDAIEDRRRETGQTRTMIKVAAIGLIGTFITSGGAVFVAILTGSHG